MHFYVLSRTYFLSHLTTPPPHLPEKGTFPSSHQWRQHGYWLARQSWCGSVLELHMIDEKKKMKVNIKFEMLLICGTRCSDCVESHGGLVGPSLPHWFIGKQLLCIKTVNCYCGTGGRGGMFLWAFSDKQGILSSRFALSTLCWWWFTIMSQHNYYSWIVYTEEIYDSFDKILH